MRFPPVFCAVVMLAFGGCASAPTPVVQTVSVQDKEAERKKLTQGFIRTGDNILVDASRRAADLWTDAGKNDVMLEALGLVLKLPASERADQAIVGEYRKVCSAANDWFSVRPTWKTMAGYGALGAIGATVDFFGGFGLASAGLVGPAAVLDMKQREKIRHSAEAARSRWNEICVQAHYDSPYWRL